MRHHTSYQKAGPDGKVFFAGGVAGDLASPKRKNDAATSITQKEESSPVQDEQDMSNTQAADNEPRISAKSGEFENTSEKSEENL